VCEAFQMTEDDSHCDNSGRCMAPVGVRSITNCIYCGKELIEIMGAWFTWDYEFFDDPQPQDYVSGEVETR
jgi:hypothetical protein